MDLPPRPSFARDFPRSTELDELVDAFSRGDYARVRAQAPSFERHTDEAIRHAARILVDRTRPDPLAVVLLVLTAALLIFLGGWWMAFGKAPPATRTRPVHPNAQHPTP